MVMIKIGKSCFYLCGRFPAGRAIRYIFFALSGQKRMPLLSLTLDPKKLYDQTITQRKLYDIKSLLKKEYYF